jgi:DNA-directed RNA polymerase II subunit RPB2
VAGVIYVRRRGGSKACWSGNSRHGQKGTMGMSYRMEDMPFTADGLVPDIIINPHAIPSRMTIGQLMECILGIACVEYGAFGDATPFTDTSVEIIGDLLQKAGHSRLGNHVLYNSRTGEQITTTIFMGPTYYQRLKHMVDDKIHSRSSNGPVVLLTRQPAEGRARDGGLRLGEMEIECQWSHGMLHFLKERFMECSDNYRVFTCRKCGMIAVCNPDKKIFSCRACKNVTAFAEVRLPYACKLLLQEIHTMGIGAKFLTD